MKALMGLVIFLNTAMIASGHGNWFNWLALGCAIVALLAEDD